MNLEEGQVWSIKFLAPLAECFMLEVGLGYKFRLSVNSAKSESGRRYPQRGQGPEGLYCGHPRADARLYRELVLGGSRCPAQKGIGVGCSGLRPSWLDCMSVGR